MFTLKHIHSLSPELMSWLASCFNSGPQLSGLIIKKLDSLQKEVTHMAEDLRARLAAIDANTTRTGEAVALVAERIRLLSEQVASGKLTEAEYQEVSAELARLAEFTGTVATNLEEVARGPVEVPPIDPGEVPPVEPLEP